MKNNLVDPFGGNYAPTVLTELNQEVGAFIGYSRIQNFEVFGGQAQPSPLSRAWGALPRFIEINGRVFFDLDWLLF